MKRTLKDRHVKECKEIQMKEKTANKITREKPKIAHIKTSGQQHVHIYNEEPANDDPRYLTLIMSQMIKRLDTLSPPHCTGCG